MLDGEGALDIATAMAATFPIPRRAHAQAFPYR